jgi:di-N-acetylchitobiase
MSVLLFVFCSFVLCLYLTRSARGSVDGCGCCRYLELGIAPSQLILGVPWYGYRYPCEKGTSPTAALCPIKEVPFRGVNCSDAAGSEVGYATLVGLIAESTSGRHWDASTSSPWFNRLEKSATTGEMETVQYWFDDPSSLALKYAVATDRGLRGTGPYTYSDAGPGETGRQMWAALAAFRTP